MSGYIIRFKDSGKEFSGYRDGRPFTLLDAYRECLGVRGVQVLSPTGRLILDNAGDYRARYEGVRERARLVRMDMRSRRNADRFIDCPICGVRCWGYATSNLWHHPRATGCDLECWNVNSTPKARPPISHAFTVVDALVYDAATDSLTRDH